jgi:hypothetical protein
MIGPPPQYRDLRGGDDFPNLPGPRGYDSGETRDLLQLLGFEPHIAVMGQPAPIQAGRRWPVERLHAWMNGYGKQRRCTGQTQGHRRVLAVPRRRVHRDPPPDQPRPQPLPLAHPAHHPSTPLTINCRSLYCKSVSGRARLRSPAVRPGE